MHTAWAGNTEGPDMCFCTSLRQVLVAFRVCHYLASMLSDY